MAFLGSTIAQSSTRTREVRRRILIGATFTCADLPDQQVMVRNVSTNGIGLTARGALPHCDEAITLRLSNGLTVTAQVRWVEGRNFGCRLDQPIDLARLERATQRRNTRASVPSGWQVEDRFAAAPRTPPSYRACFL